MHSTEAGCKTYAATEISDSTKTGSGRDVHDHLQRYVLLRVQKNSSHQPCAMRPRDDDERVLVVDAWLPSSSSPVPSVRRPLDPLQVNAILACIAPGTTRHNQPIAGFERLLSNAIT
jgi:hypothetical protein